MVVLEPPRVNLRWRDWNALGLAGVLGGVALIGILPFLWSTHHFPIPSLDSELVSAWCLGFALLCSGMLTGTEASIRWPLPAVLVGLAAVVLLQQWLDMLTYAQQATRFFLFEACLLSAYLMGRRIVAVGRAGEATDAFCAAVLVGALFSVFVQGLQLIDYEELPRSIAAVYKDAVVQTRPFGNLAQANHLATYLGMALMSALYLAARLRRNWIVVASFLFASCGLAMTGSRMGAVFTFIAVAALFAPTGLRPESRHLRWTGAVALLAGYAAGLIAVRLVAGEFDTLTRVGQNTWPLRMELWWQAWQIAVQHPWLGLGVGQFAAGQYWVARPSPFVVPANNAHNIVLQLAAEFGWPAALAVCAIGAAWALRDLRARVSHPESALALGVALLIAMHSLLEFPLWHLYFAIPAALFFGMAEPMRGNSVPLNVRVILPTAGLAILGVGLSFSINYYWIAQAFAPLWLETNHIRNRTVEDSFLVMSIADSKLFQPEADRLLITLNHPVDENTDGPLRRTGRVARWLPAPEVIAQYIAQLAQAGRIDEATQHTVRLRVFAHDQYPVYRDWILESTRGLGPQTAPLRHLLRQPL